MARAAWDLTRDNFFSLEEVDRLSDFLKQQVSRATEQNRNSAVLDRLIIAGLLYSGLRNSEFCRLAIDETAVGQGESVFVVSGTPRQNRTVYVPRFLSELVAEFVSDVRPNLLKPDRSEAADSLPLIVHERGRAYERTGLYRRVVRILTAAGLGDKASVQVLRHTYGYLGYLRTGGNLLFLQRQMGHAHPMVTHIYAQFVEESYAELADKLAGDFAADKHS